MRSPIKKVEDKTSFRAVMLTVIFLLSWLEAMVPLGVPGVKFGFSNLVILICLTEYGFREALAMAVLKILMSTVLFNGFSAFLYTMGGAFASCCSMGLAIRLYETKKISTIGVSAIGGFFHITAQYVIAAYTLYTPSVFALYPPAAALTLVTSAVMGFLAAKIIKQLHTISYDYE